MLSCAAMVAQDTLRQYTDTLDARELTLKADDSYLLDLTSRQAQTLAEREDSIHRYRLENDLTTLDPLHIGYADSLRIADNLRKQQNTTLLCLPMLYHPQEPMHFAPLDYSFPQKQEEPSRSIRCISPRESARQYMTTYAAGLYAGTYDPTKVEHDDVSETKSVYELEVAAHSLIKDVDEERRARLAVVKNQKNPWFKEVNLMLQFTQNYATDNWYEGGASSFTAYASAKGKIKYDAGKRINWETQGEWTAGTSMTRGDTIHKINTSEDLFRIYSKLGVKVINKLYGSFSLEYRSQVFSTFKSNSMELKTGFCTPIRFNLAVGVDYKPVKGLSLVFSPVAYKMVFANDTARAPYTTYGIKEGEKILNEVGTSARVEWTWKPLREISLETKFYAYTNYKMVELDLEVNCDFIINRFISARVMLHPRYDSSRILDGDQRAKVQFKDLISLGFAHKFY